MFERLTYYFTKPLCWAIRALACMLGCTWHTSKPTIIIRYYYLA